MEGDQVHVTLHSLDKILIILQVCLPHTQTLMSKEITMPLLPLLKASKASVGVHLRATTFSIHNVMADGRLC